MSANSKLPLRINGFPLAWAPTDRVSVRYLNRSAARFDELVQCRFIGSIRAPDCICRVHRLSRQLIGLGLEFPECIEMSLPVGRAIRERHFGSNELLAAPVVVLERTIGHEHARHDVSFAVLAREAHPD